ncbi:MAG: putative ABC transporter permease [Butyrivibrio sp.]|nr:putative ABC transporter permease [Butyrivibrio sp.]
MFNYIPIQWLFLFYLYSFAGWCWETLYVSILEKRFVNRGFMRGPFLPLYGTCGIMMLIVSRPYYDNILLLYIAGCIGATAIELFTGVLMEVLFKVRYWTYSHKKFNFKGYICLESSLFWGVPTVVFTHYLQLPIEKMMMMIPYRILSVATILLTAYISFDFAVAFRTAIELRDVLIYMDKAKTEMEKMQKRLEVLIQTKSEEVKEGIGNRIDVLTSTLDKTFSAAKEKISLNPSAYVNEVRDEIFELYTKYRIITERFTPKPVKSFFEWYKNRTLLDTNMESEEYKASLEELKERASQSKGKK